MFSHYRPDPVDRSARLHSYPSAAVVTAVVAALGLGFLTVPAPAGAAPPGPDTPHRYALTSTPPQRVAGKLSDGSDLPADALGAPSNSTVVRSDQLLLSRNDAAGQSVQALRPQPDLKTNTSITPPADDASRTVINSAYPTGSGRFLDSAAEKALGFRHVRVGSNSVWQLSDIGAPAADSSSTSIKNPDGPPQAGATYLVEVDGQTDHKLQTGTAGWATRLSFGSDAGVKAQWSVEAGSTPNTIRFSSRFDGLCLDALDGATTIGSPVGSYPCQAGGANQDWTVNDRGVVINSATTLALQMSSDGLLQQATVADGTPLVFAQRVEAQGVIPTVSFADGDSPDAPSDLAVGDLDGVVDKPAASYHDEAVVAWADDGHELQVRVIDYNRPNGTSTITSPTLTDPSKPLAVVGGPDASKGYRPGSVNVAVGDFAGDSTNQIAITWQDADSAFHVTFLRYSSDAGGSPRLSVDSVQPLVVDAPSSALLRVAGLSDVAVGDFDGTGRESLALSSARFVTPGTKRVDVPVPYLTVTRFVAQAHGLQAEAHQTTQLTGNNVLNIGQQPSKLKSTLPVSTGLGIKLAAGRFDPKQLNPTIRQIASAAHVQNAGQYADDPSGDPFREVAVNQVEVGQDKPNTLDISSVVDPVNVSNGASNSGTLSLAGGGLSGDSSVGPPDDDSYTPPPWGLAVTGQAKSGPFVQYLAISTGAKTTLSKTWSSAPSGGGSAHILLTAYDRAGDSMLLGVPVVVTITGMPKVRVVAAAPPKHADWLNGTWLNVSRNEKFTLEMGSSTEKDFTTDTTKAVGSEFGYGQKFEAKAKLKVGASGLFEAGAKVTAGLKLEQQRDHEKTTETENTALQTGDVITEANDDDQITSDITTTYLYQYPILNQALTTTDGKLYTDPKECPTACYGFYTVAVPGKADPNTSVVGRNLSWYEPTWENGNVLSYPDLPDGNDSFIPAGDQGTYTNGSGKIASTPLFNHVTTVGANAGDISLAVDNTTSSSSVTSSTRTYSESQYINSEAFAKFIEMKYGASVDVDFSQNSSISHIDAGKTTFTSKSTFHLKVPEIPANRGYTMKTTYYYDKSGAQKVLFAVGGFDDQATQSHDFWHTRYGLHPDPALSLPNAKVQWMDDLHELNDLRWASESNRQQIRGFKVVLPEGSPQGTNPVQNTKVNFEVPVHNYSLKATTNKTTVAFSAVPIDNDGKVQGEPIDIGTTEVGPLEARGRITATSPDWNASANGRAAQQWRIFAVLDLHADPGDEIHPLTGTPCPAEETTDRTDLIDPMTGERETLGCGQNNQGFGLVTVTDQQLQSGPPAAVDLAGSTLLDAGRAPLLGAAQSEIDHAVVGQPVTGVVRASAANTTPAQYPVLVFDGDPKDGKLIAATTMGGVAGRDGGATTFSWTPTTPGVHTLHQVLLGATAQGGKSVQTLSVTVLPHREADHLALRPARPSITAGNRVAVRVVAVDRYGNDVDDLTGKAQLTLGSAGSCDPTGCTLASTGIATITATIGGLRGSTEVAVERPVPKTLAIASGNYQSIEPKQRLPRPMTVQVSDQAGYPMANQKVDWFVAHGPAQFSTEHPATQTNRTGIATAPPMRATSRTGPVAVRAAMAGTSVIFSHSVAADPEASTDLAARLSLPTRAKRASKVTAKVTISNRSHHVAAGATVAVTLPRQLRFRGGHGGHRAGNTVLYTVPRLEPRGTHTIKVSLEARGLGKARVDAVVLTAGRDPKPANNRDHDTIRVKH